MQTTCPKCGTVNRAGARFCGKCGAALAAPPPVPPVPRPAPIQAPYPASMVPPARPPAAPGGTPNRKVIIALTIALVACVGLMIVGGGAYIYTQALAATPTPGTNITTVVAPIQSQIPAIQSKIPEIQTQLPELKTVLPIPSGIPTSFQIPTSIPTSFQIPTGLPNLPGFPGLFATATPKP